MVDSYTAQDIIIAEDYNGEWVLTDFADNTVAELTAPVITVILLEHIMSREGKEN